MEKACPFKSEDISGVFCHLAIKAPSTGRFASNFAQMLIGPWNTINKSVESIGLGLYFVKIFKTVRFEHNVQEFVVLYFGCVLVFQNYFDDFLSGGSTDASCNVWY